jgi:hypothetical protein
MYLTDDLGCSMRIPSRSELGQADGATEYDTQSEASDVELWYDCWGHLQCCAAQVAQSVAVTPAARAEGTESGPAQVCACDTPGGSNYLAEQHCADAPLSVPEAGSTIWQ